MAFSMQVSVQVSNGKTYSFAMITFLIRYTDPFREDNQFIYILPLQQHVQYNYDDMVTAKQPHDLVFSASTIEPLSLSQLTAKFYPRQACAH